MISAAVRIAGSYNHLLVVLSVLIGMFASFAALDLAGRVTAARGWAPSGWLAGGATAMGIGIWSMHLTGILAINLPVAVAYHWPIVLLSLLAAILASAVALYVVSRKKMGRARGQILRLAGGAHAIAKRKQAKEAQRRSEELLGIAFAEAAVGFAIKDANGRFVRVNQAYCRITGYSEEELCAMDFHAITHKEDLPGNLQEMERLLTGEVGSVVYEKRYVTKSSEIVWVRNSVSPIRDSDCTITGFVTLIEDITERKRTEELRQHIEEHHRMVVETASDAVVRVDEMGQILFANSATTKIFGYPTAELIGRPVTALAPESLRETYDASMHRYLANGQRCVHAHGIELVGLRSNGEEFPVEISFGEAEEKGRRTFTGFIRDITERKRAEAALRESEDRYRDLVEHSNDLICTHDAQGMLLSVNEAPLRILGYSRDELLNKPLRDFVTPEERPLCDAYLARIQRDGFAKGLLPVLTKSGEVRLWEYNNSLRKEGVSSPIVRGMAHDVTEQKRAEAALRRSEEKFHKVFHSSPVEMFITTLEEGRFLDINETLERNAGYTRDELIGCTKLELGLWVEPAERAAIVEEVKKNGRVIAREIQIRSKSGEIGTKLYSAELLKIGRELCLLAVCEDITDRKRAQENLLRSEAFLAAGQRLSHTGSWAWNPSSGELFWSVETFRIFGFDPATTKPTVEIFLQCVHREDRPILEQVLDRVVREKCDLEVDYRIVLPNGSVKYIHSVALPIFDSSGGLTEFVGTVIDVTDSKKTEEELRRLSSQLLQLHDEERRSIARDLHDSTGQNLVALGTILGQLHSSIPSSNRKSRKLISQSQALTKRCIREVRTLSYVLYPPMLDEAGLEVAICHYRDGFEERTGISVELEISPRFKRLAREAELALFRVVQESLANIQRHSGSPTAKVLLAHQPGMVLLEVSDKGCRICANERKRPGALPFNIGVGIASMQERVKQVGGRLEIESNCSGTTVRATIPADD